MGTSIELVTLNVRPSFVPCFALQFDADLARSLSNTGKDPVKTSLVLVSILAAPFGDRLPMIGGHHDTCNFGVFLSLRV